MAVDPRQVNKTFSLMGSSFINGAGTLIDKLRSGQVLALKRQPTNEHDTNAVLVMWGARPLGWLPRQLASKIAPIMDSGVEVIVRKSPPMPKFGAFRGIFELAYIPPEGNADAVPQPENQGPDSEAEAFADLGLGETVDAAE